MVHASLLVLVKVLCRKTIITWHEYKVHFVTFMRVYGSKLAYEAVSKAAGPSPLSQNGLVKIICSKMDW